MLWYRLKIQCLLHKREHWSLSLLEAIRYSDKTIKFYQASSSEMYGGKAREPLNEDSRFDPRSPYLRQSLAHNMTKMYRDLRSFCVNGICLIMNHLKEVKLLLLEKLLKFRKNTFGIQEKLTLGNLDASVEIAGDYVEGMWKMMNTKPQ